MWPHLRRLWAALGTVGVGLTINYLYGIWDNESVPHLSLVANFLTKNCYWSAGALLLLITVSIFAERAHRRHLAPHFIGEHPRPTRRTVPETPPPVAPLIPAARLVGRDSEIARISSRFERVLGGERAVIFVAGEAGVGKTAFVRTFLSALTKQGTIYIGCGQCVEQFGSGEPYLPVLAALTDLGRGPTRKRLLAILHRLAPAWLGQLESLLTVEERARIQSETHGVTQHRMLREMTLALEALTAEAPVVLLLEDLHWSDYSTPELIASIARRQEMARLLILATYRPVEMLSHDHPLRALKAELELHNQCEELRLHLLSAEVAGLP